MAGKRLALNPSVFDGKHGTVLDSGTTYAYLPEAAFSAFKDAIMKELHSVQQVRGPDPSYNDICFSGAGSDISQLLKTFPAVEMVFGNGQKLSLSPENYLFRVGINVGISASLSYFVFSSKTPILIAISFLSIFFFLLCKALKSAWCILPGGFPEWQGSDHSFRRNYCPQYFCNV